MKIPTVIARKAGYALVKDPGGSAGHFGKLAAGTNLRAVHIRNGKTVREYDFGSGKLTEAMVVAMAKDSIGATADPAAPILSKMKYMFTGIGTAAEQATDYALQTPINVASGAITPTLSMVASTNNALIQWVGTIAYTGASAVTEWGLFNSNTVGSLYNTSAVTYSSTTITPTASPGWTTNLMSSGIAICGASSGTANQTGASYYGAYIESNTSSVLTIGQPDGISYWTINNNGGAGIVPTNNTRFDIWPLMADHKTFAPINVNNGDQIQFTYTLTLQSGG